MKTLFISAAIVAITLIAVVVPKAHAADVDRCDQTYPAALVIPEASKGDVQIACSSPSSVELRIAFDQLREPGDEVSDPDGNDYWMTHVGVSFACRELMNGSVMIGDYGPIKDGTFDAHVIPFNARSHLNVRFVETSRRGERYGLFIEPKWDRVRVPDTTNASSKKKSALAANVPFVGRTGAYPSYGHRSDGDLLGKRSSNGRERVQKRVIYPLAHTGPRVLEAHRQELLVAMAGCVRDIRAVTKWQIKHVRESPYASASGHDYR